LLINSAVSGSHQADGLHLTSHDLLACRERPQNYDWVSASCHSLEQLQHAENIGLDFAVLAPVLPTQTHPEAKALGWELVVEWLEEVNLPVYALGGMALPLLPSAKQAGARGIAAIRAFLA
jgi:8-oxo-dGTP diphosphatase